MEGQGREGESSQTENLLGIFLESSQKEPAKLNRDNKKDPLIYRKTRGGWQGDVTYGEYQYGCFFFHLGFRVELIPRVSHLCDNTLFL